jgi:HSP20 family protein
MKNRNKFYGAGLVALLISGAVIYPVYAAEKDSAKCKAANGCQKSQNCKQVVAKSDDDAFGNQYEETQWNPFAEFIRMQNDMNSLLNGTFNPYRDDRSTFNSPDNSFAAPACDINESDGNYQITIDLPGMKKSDIKIKIDGNILTVTGESSTSVEKKDGNRVILQERTRGSFRRSIRLARNIKKDKVEASYENGTLNITLPQEEPVDTGIEIPIK